MFSNCVLLDSLNFVYFVNGCSINSCCGAVFLKRIKVYSLRTLMDEVAHWAGRSCNLICLGGTAIVFGSTVVIFGCIPIRKTVLS
jgi:hypothetical protein